MKYIGTKASSMIDGAFTPTAMTTKPSVAARLYAGAVDAVPMTIDDSSPTVPGLSPLSRAVPSGRRPGASATADRPPPRAGFDTQTASPPRTRGGGHAARAMVSGRPRGAIGDRASVR